MRTGPQAATAERMRETRCDNLARCPAVWIFGLLAERTAGALPTRTGSAMARGRRENRVAASRLGPGTISRAGREEPRRATAGTSRTILRHRPNGGSERAQAANRA